MSRRIPALLLLLPLLLLPAACGTPVPSTAGGSDLMPADMPRPRARRPSSDRPPWLPVLPPNIPRIRTDEGLRANLG